MRSDPSRVDERDVCLYIRHMATTKPSRARKRVTKPAPKTNQINIRISDEQKDLLVRAAETAGMSMSTFVLSAGLEKARKITERAG
jgi:predicted HicB family RNase H-like nuclease